MGSSPSGPGSSSPHPARTSPVTSARATRLRLRISATVVMAVLPAELIAEGVLRVLLRVVWVHDLRRARVVVVVDREPDCLALALVDAAVGVAGVVAGVLDVVVRAVHVV